MSCIICKGSGAGIRTQLCKQCASNSHEWLLVCYLCKKEMRDGDIDKIIAKLRNLHFSDFHHQVDIA